MSNTLRYVLAVALLIILFGANSADAIDLTFNDTTANASNETVAGGTVSGTLVVTNTDTLAPHSGTYEITITAGGDTTIFTGNVLNVPANSGTVSVGFSGTIDHHVTWAEALSHFQNTYDKAGINLAASISTDNFIATGADTAAASNPVHNFHIGSSEWTWVGNYSTGNFNATDNNVMGAGRFRITGDMTGGGMENLLTLSVANTITGGTITRVGTVTADTITGGTIDAANSATTIVVTGGDITGGNIVTTGNGSITTANNIGGTAAVNTYNFTFGGGTGNYTINSTGAVEFRQTFTTNGSLTVASNVNLAINNNISNNLTVTDTGIIHDGDNVNVSVKTTNSGIIDNIFIFTSGSLENNFNGLISDVKGLYVTNDLLNKGRIDSIVDLPAGGGTLAVGGNLTNQGVDSFIVDYASIYVTGNLINTDGGTIVPGRWYYSVTAAPGSSADVEAGFIKVDGDVFNTNNSKIGVNTGGYAGTEGFDRFIVLGTLTNDATSEITAGHLAAVNGGIMQTVLDKSNYASTDGGFTQLRAGTISNAGDLHTIDVISAGNIINSGTIDDIFILTADTINNSGGEITNIADRLSVTGNFTNTLGTVDTVEKMSVGGNLTNSSGTITNIADYIYVIGNLSNTETGLISDVKQIVVGGNLTNSSDITNVTDYIYVIGDLSNTGAGSISDVNKIVVGRNLTNSGDITNVTDFINVTANFTNTGLIDDVNRIDVGGTFSNNGGDITNVTDHISVAGNFTNTGLIDDVNRIDVGGTFSNSGGYITNVTDHFSVDGDLNNAGGTINKVRAIDVTGSFTTGQNADINNIGSILVGGGGLTVNSGSTVSEVGTIAVSGPGASINIEANAAIENVRAITVERDFNNDGTADGNSVGMVSVGRDLNNNAAGSLRNFLSVSVGRNLNNTGDITDSGAFSVKGNIVNSGTISDLKSLYAGGSINNSGIISDLDTLYAGGKFTDTGVIEDVKVIYAGGAFDLGSESNRNGSISGFSEMSVGGTLTVFSGNEIDVLAGSTLTAQSIITKIDGEVKDNGYIYGANFDHSGLLTGNGVVETGSSFINRGTIAPGNGIPGYRYYDPGTNNMKYVLPVPGAGTLTVVGNFNNTATGTLEIELLHPVNSLVSDRVDMIRVTNGTATINGGRVQVITPEDAVWVDGKRYVFLQTDPMNEITGETYLRVFTPLTADFGVIDPDTNNLVQQPIRMFDLALNYDTRAGQYYFDASRYYYYGEGPGTEGETFNQRAVGRYIDTWGSSPIPGTGFWDLLEALDALNGNIAHRTGLSPEAIRALDELSGAIYGTIGTATVMNTNVVNNTIANVLRSDVFKFSYIGNPNNALRGVRGQAPTPPPLRWNRWGTGFGVGGESKYDDNASGYKSSYGGGIVGFDRSWWTGSRLGVYISGADGTINLKELNERSRSREFLIGLYLRQEMQMGYFLADIGFGQALYKTTRNATLLGGTFSSRHYGDIGTVSLERGIDMPFFYGTISPYANLQVVAVQQDDFTETGSAGRLVADGADTNSCRFAFGFRSSTSPIPVRWGQFAFSTNLNWTHEFADTLTEFKARFADVGGGFLVKGNETKRDWANFGLGVHFDRNSTRVFVDYSGYANDQQLLHTGNAGFIVAW